MEWISECETYFREKETKDDKKVSKVLGGLQDPLIKDWYNPDIARITTLTWEVFQAELGGYAASGARACGVPARVPEAVAADQQEDQTVYLCTRCVSQLQALFCFGLTIDIVFVVWG